MIEAENFEEQTLERQRLMLDSVFEGDPEPYMGMWSQREPVSLFGAWGPCKTGWSELSETFRWAGSRFADGEMTYDLEVAYAGEDLAYTVGYERGEVAVDGREEADDASGHPCLPPRGRRVEAGSTVTQTLRPSTRACVDQHGPPRKQKGKRQ